MTKAATKKPAKESRPVRVTAGSVAYAELVARSTHATLSRRLGLSEATSLFLARGERRPGPATKTKLVAMGIPALAWSQRAPRARKAAPLPELSGPPTAAELARAEDPIAVARSTVVLLQRALDRLYLDPAATPQQQASMSKALAGAVRHYSTLREAERATTAALLKAEIWLPIQAVLVEALGPIEGAAAAAAAALRKLAESPGYA